MTFYVTDQNIVVLSLFLLGAALGLCYDLLRLKRQFLRPSAFMGSLGDLLFWLIVTALFILTIHITNYGYVRWYEFVAAGAGFLLYRAALSSLVLKALRFVVICILRTVRFLLNPVRSLLRCLKNSAFALLKRVRSFTNRCAARRYSRRRLQKDLKITTVVA